MPKCLPVDPSELRAPGAIRFKDIPVNAYHMNVSCGTVAYYSLENKVALQLSYASVQSVEITEKGTNYMVSITTDTDTIRLLSPKKGVSAFLGATGAWHMNHLDDTLQMLKDLAGNTQ